MLLDGGGRVRSCRAAADADHGHVRPRYRHERMGDRAVQLGRCQGARSRQGADRRGARDLQGAQGQGMGPLSGHRW